VRAWDADDMRYRPQSNWLIDQMVEEKGLTVFFGPDKAGKTAFLSSMLWAWANGRDWWFDQTFQMSNPAPQEGDSEDTIPRRVLYLLLEGQAAYGDRLEAWKEANGVEGFAQLPGFLVVDTGVSLFAQGMVIDKKESWTNDLKAVTMMIQQFRPHILVVDTLSRATAGMDENSSQMAQVVAWFDLMRDLHDCATVVVHHTALDKAASARPRGHSSLKGAASSYVRIEKPDENNTPRLVVGPHRNAEAVNPSVGNTYGWYFQMKPHRTAFVIETATAQKGGRPTVANKYARVVGWNVADAAAELGVSEKTVRNRMTVKDNIVQEPEAETPEVL